MAAHFATASAIKCWRAYLRAAHETREREAARLIARYRAIDELCQVEPDENGTFERAYTRRPLGPLSESEIAFLKCNSKAAE
jgi:hypothetical protein